MNDRESVRMTKIVGWSLVGLVAVIGISIALSFAFSQGQSPHYPFFPFPFGWLGGIFLLFIVFWIARGFWPRRESWQRHQYRSAESFVKERYAKGEITKEQFEQMMDDLGE